MSESFFPEKIIPEIGSPDCPQENEPSNPENEQQKAGEGSTLSAVTAEGKHVFHSLTVIGQIEGHYTLPPTAKATKYEQIIPQLIAVEESPEIKGLLIILNTVGGDVEAGLAIAELISGMKKPTVSLVLGGGHSIGVPLAVSADRSFIVPTATMTVHPVRMNGLVLGVRESFDVFLKMQDRITEFVIRNSRISKKRFTELMTANDQLVTDVGSMLDGKQAVKEGLIDEMCSLKDAVACLYRLIEKETS